MGPPGSITLSYKEAFDIAQTRHMSATKLRPNVKEIYHPSYISGGNMQASGSTASKIQFSRSPSAKYVQAMGLEHQRKSMMEGSNRTLLLPKVPVSKTDLGDINKRSESFLKQEIEKM